MTDSGLLLVRTNVMISQICHLPRPLVPPLRSSAGATAKLPDEPSPSTTTTTSTTTVTPSEKPKKTLLEKLKDPVGTIKEILGEAKMDRAKLAAIGKAKKQQPSL